MVSNCIQPDSGSTLSTLFGLFFLSRFSVVSLDKLWCKLALYILWNICCFFRSGAKVPRSSTASIWPSTLWKRCYYVWWTQTSLEQHNFWSDTTSGEMIRSSSLGKKSIRDFLMAAKKPFLIPFNTVVSRFIGLGPSPPKCDRDILAVTDQVY